MSFCGQPKITVTFSQSTDIIFSETYSTTSISGGSVMQFELSYRGLRAAVDSHGGELVSLRDPAGT